MGDGFLFIFSLPWRWLVIHPHPNPLLSRGEGNNSGKTFEKPSLLQYRHAGPDPVLMPLCGASSVIKYFLDPGLRRGDDNAGLVEFCKGIKGRGKSGFFDE